MSPQGIRSAEFKTVRKGADPDEVRVFLNDVADELERAQNQSSAMEARARAAVARLQEVTEAREAAPEAAGVPAEESETISRTLLLAQRTADNTVAEARGEAARIVAAANAEAATTLDSTREMAAQLIDEARTEARRVGEAERLSIASEVESLKARRDFLESDVDQLEKFMADQRSRLREAATALVDITERVPGGLGATRAPLLSASDDTAEVPATPAAPEAPTTQEVGVVAGDAAVLPDADTPPSGAEMIELPESWNDDATTAMASVELPDDGGGDHADDDFRFSFDDERS
ncbi:MAG: DivIVA domain-containing protein [Acidobacteriota bacterium]